MDGFLVLDTGTWQSHVSKGVPKILSHLGTKSELVIHLGLQQHLKQPGTQKILRLLYVQYKLLYLGSTCETLYIQSA